MRQGDTSAVGGGDAAGSAEPVVIHFRLRIGDQTLETEAPVPGGPSRSVEILPVIQALSSGVVDAACGSLQDGAEGISCRAGCGACCRQPVPIAESEAVMLAEAIEAMPEPRRSELRRRFERAVEALDRHGLLDRLRALGGLESVDARQALGREYLELGIACPFLEEESCSIHPIRPLACREYLVTSPAESCADPRPEAIEMVPIPSRPSVSLFRLEGDQLRAAPRSIVLTLALEWTERTPDAESRRAPGPAIFEAFVRGLAGGAA